MIKVFKSLLIVLSLLLVQNSYSTQFMVIAKMNNGDVLTGQTSIDSIQVKTKYGTLDLPSEVLNKVTFGIRETVVDTATILEALKQIQNDNNIELTKKNYNNLLSKGSSIIPIVKLFMDSDDFKVSSVKEFTAENLLEVLLNKSELDISSAMNDVVAFGENSRIEGKINLDTIVLQTTYGELNINRSKIVNLDFTVIQDANLLENTYKLRANKNITGNANGKPWINSGIFVQKGDTLLLKSSGKIKLQTLSGGIFSPDGYFSGTKDKAYDSTAEIPYGSIVYKIGENGDQHKANSETTIIAERNGFIYLSIFETAFNENNTGFFLVKIIK